MKMNAVMCALSIILAPPLNGAESDAREESEVAHQENARDTAPEDLDQERDFLGRDGVDGSVW